jgi:hypothetical protein
MLRTCVVDQAHTLLSNLLLANVLDPKFHPARQVPGDIRYELTSTYKG